jgi:predicted 2-oxoglutarate/Fe(II)-dependent dioxygenase YbiX
VATADFFSQLGLFVVREFFDPATCAALRAAARAAATTPATVYDGAEQRKLDAAARKTLRAHVAPDVLDVVKSRIMALKPAVERHYKVSLTACTEAQFLVYGVGDFFSAHADGGDDPDEPEGIRARKISLVIFLSGEAADGGEGSHAGGSLVFYDLLADPRLSARGLPLTAEQGLLVAFSATTVHRVNVVTSGERYSIVSWFV